VGVNLGVVDKPRLPIAPGLLVGGKVSVCRVVYVYVWVDMVKCWYMRVHQGSFKFIWRNMYTYEWMLD
jgi:hypothetical protein